jgi:hypothetical protein
MLSSLYLYKWKYPANNDYTRGCLMHPTDIAVVSPPALSFLMSLSYVEAQVVGATHETIIT